MSLKKLVLFIVIFFKMLPSYCVTFNELWEYVLENNLEIKEAEIQYRKSIVDKKFLEGEFVPGILFAIENKKKDLLSTISLEQKIPSGTDLNFILDVKNDSLDFGFVVNQSLIPYWLQDVNKNPLFMNYSQKENYYLKQLNYIKEYKLKELLSSYCEAIINKAEIIYYEKQISFFAKKRQNLISLYNNGDISYFEIIQTDNYLCDCERKLSEYKIYLMQYLSEIQNLSGIKENIFQNESSIVQLEQLLKDIKLFKVNEFDVKEQILMLKHELIQSEKILHIQNTAPLFSLEIQSDFYNSDSFKTKLSVDFGSFIKEKFIKKKQQYNVELNKVSSEIELYRNQKKYIKTQYKNMKEDLNIQLKEIEFLINEKLTSIEDCKNNFELGIISEMDYEESCLEFTSVETFHLVLDARIFFYDYLLYIM